MHESTEGRSLRFFNSQFQKQVAQGDFVLNSFEEILLPFVKGDVLDLGCGLGNFAVAAARAGHRVLALDGSEHAVAALEARALAEQLPVFAEKVDLATPAMAGAFDTVACIGLLMFFPPATAYDWIDNIRKMTRQGGVVGINVSINGTTFLDMFDPSACTLFHERALDNAFADWEVLYSDIAEFPAPEGAIKRFSTVVARRP